MIKINTASSSSVKPGDADDAPRRAIPLARRGAGPGRNFIALSLRLAGVYLARSVRAFGAAFAERFQRVGVPIALVEVLISPWILRQALDVTAGLVVGGRATAGRRRNQRTQALVGGGIETVVEVVAIECGLDLGEVGLRLGRLGLVGGAAQTLYDDRREQTQDQNNYHDFNQGESILIVSA